MQDLDEVFARVSSPDGRRLALEHIAKTQHGPIYGSDPAEPGVIIEIAHDGSKRRGRFIDRKFVEDAK